MPGGPVLHCCLHWYFTRRSIPRAMHTFLFSKWLIITGFIKNKITIVLKAVIFIHQD